MNYVYSIPTLIDFTKINKHKVINLPKNQRFDEIYNLIKNAGLSYELEDRCCDELEDTTAEILEILGLDYSNYKHNVLV
ncbi:hypothetical protein HYH38_16475 [Clostridium botulinum]|uniref:hypothetical protein n=1 Tax=Clostridium botulinum TaxID=1491 RepID=UPI00155DC7D6|nr:hypothetical protein [Clostridium botulinum]MBY6811059.1 hypothetical protein [Clostridium botulinum]MBY6818536.1 hypothetical protein [Clostridium botulinum]MBY6824527.1 hypothetical protein [Clostridium botulinum]MBY6828830.1 hypothetical protein [Clostridium botulinum]MBY6832759.1 hypothetical protein [Clostridium botulinum]